MDFSKFVNENLDNLIEAIFADMIDDGFIVSKDVSMRMYDVKITKRSSDGITFNILTYKDHIKQLFDISQKKGIEIFNSLVYLDGRSQSIQDVDSILKDSVVGTNFKGKTWEDFWDGLTFTIYYKSEKNDITNLTITFCEIN